MAIDDLFERQLRASLHEALDREMGSDAEWIGSPAEQQIRLPDQRARGWPLRLLAVAALLVVGSGAAMLGVIGGLPPRPAVPALTPADGLIAYLTPLDDFGPADLNFVQPNGTNLRQVPGAADPGSIAFSPDGTRLALRRNFNLRVLEASSGAELIEMSGMTSSGPVIWRDPRWSPDGAALLTDAVTESPGSGWPGWAADTWSFDLATEARTQLTQLANGPAFWSPDGRWLLVPAKGDLFIVPRTSLTDEPITDPERAPGSRRLTNNGGWKYIPSWSPDGATIIWVSESVQIPNIGGRIEAVDVATGIRTTLIDPGCAPAWSPDGRSIAYLTGRRGNPEGFDAWVVSRDGSDRRRLGSSWTGPRWSPSGAALLLDASAGLLLVSREGGTALPIAEGRRWYSAAHLDWRASEWICHESERFNAADWQSVH